MNAQDRLIEYENSYLFEGGECDVFPEDDHQRHIDEHNGWGENVRRHIEDHRRRLTALVVA